MRRFLPLLSLIISLSVQAQINLFDTIPFEPATLYLRNGKTLEGFANIKEERVRFRKKADKGKRETYTYKTLKEFKINEDGEETVYKYKIVPDVGPRLVKVLGEPKKGYALYSYTIEMTPGGGGGSWVTTGGGPVAVKTTFVPGVPNGTLNNDKIIYGYRYYISKDPESYAVLKLWSDSNGRGDRHFRETMSEYFGDCPALIEKVENEEFSRENVQEIVEFYNKHCSK